MIIKLKIYGDEVTITDGVASSSNRLLEQTINDISKKTGLGGPTSQGYLPTLGEIFGKNLKLIDVEGEPSNIVH
jgi:hypothetical protein